MAAFSGMSITASAMLRQAQQNELTFSPSQENGSVMIAPLLITLLLLIAEKNAKKPVAAAAYALVWPLSLFAIWFMFRYIT